VYSACGLLSRILFQLNPAAGPDLVTQTSVQTHVVARVLDSGPWRNADPAVRQQHAATLADMLGSPRAEVRRRAATAMRYFLPELSGVWPAVVATFTMPDEQPSWRLLPLVRLLQPVADTVCEELLAYFDEPNTRCAARAGVALWRLGRWNDIAPKLLAGVGTERTAALVREMLDHAQGAHGLSADMATLFAGTALVVDARTRVSPNASVFDSVLLDFLTAGTITPAMWGKLRDAFAPLPEPVQALVALAFMLAFSAREFGPLKIWMIKRHRDMTLMSLSESKRAVENVIDWLSETPSAEQRAKAVREFFPWSVELPEDIHVLFNDPVAACRWSALELACAWGLRREEVVLWVEDRRRDVAPFVCDSANRFFS
jgi:hypothetical protein